MTKEQYTPKEAAEWDTPNPEQITAAIQNTVEQEGGLITDEALGKLQEEASGRLNNFGNKLPGGYLFFDHIAEREGGEGDWLASGDISDTNKKIYFAMKEILKNDFPEVDTKRYREIGRRLWEIRDEIVEKGHLSPFGPEINQRLQESEEYQSLSEEYKKYREDYVKPFYIKLRRRGFTKNDLCI